jgi:hypothetical protein
MLQWFLYIVMRMSAPAFPYIATAVLATTIIFVVFARLQGMLLPCIEFLVVGGMTACLITWMLY